MDDAMGRLVYLPAGASGPDPEAFLEDVLTGWRRAQLAQGTSTETIRRRNAQVLRMADFVGAFPWQWTPVVPPKSWRVSYAASGWVLASLIS